MNKFYKIIIIISLLILSKICQIINILLNLGQIFYTSEFSIYSSYFTRYVKIVLLIM